MKKLIAILMLSALCVSFASAEEGAETFVPTDSKVLVACFSATGNTWPLAGYAAEYLNADLYRIEPEAPYTDADLNYSDGNCRANREMEDDASRPALAGTVENMDQYDTVIIAFPIWWGQAPRLIETFIEAHDLTGKTVLTFCTSGSSGYGRTGEILSALTDDTVNWMEGARFSPGATADEMAAWLAETGLEPHAAQ